MDLPDHRKRDNTGFTLIEIIAVLLILGILTAIAINHAGDFLSGNDLILEASTLKSNLRYVQMRAMNSSDNGTWRVQISDNDYTVTQNTNPLLSAATWEMRSLPGDEKASAGTHTFDSGVQASPAPQTIYFNTWGIPVQSNGDRDNNDTTITLTKGVNSKGLLIRKNTGYISIQ